MSFLRTCSPGQPAAVRAVWIGVNTLSWIDWKSAVIVAEPLLEPPPEELLEELLEEPIGCPF